MWSYYGSKNTIAKLYPPPRFNKVIEPFAGTAQYSLIHFENDVILMDKFEEIIRIWKWLQECSPKDIYSLPRFTFGDNINSVEYDCEEQRLLVGYGSRSARNTATARIGKHRPNQYNHNLKKVATQLFKIRHWDIRLGSYNEIRNQKGTWFIDPPYQHGGHAYRKSNKHIDFKKLAKWCESRKGRVMVCENEKADWMDFVPMVTHRTAKGFTKEMIWTNFETSFSQQQLEMQL